MAESFDQPPLPFSHPVSQPEAGRLTLFTDEVQLPLNERYLRLATEATASGVEVLFEPPLTAERPAVLQSLTSQSQYMGFEHFLAHTATDPRFRTGSHMTTRAFNNCIIRPGGVRYGKAPNPIEGLIIAARPTAGLPPLMKELRSTPGNILSAQCRQYAINIGSFIITFQSGTRIPLSNSDTSQFYLRCLANRLAKNVIGTV